MAFLYIVSFFAKHCIIHIRLICVLKKASHPVDSEKSGMEKILIKSTPAEVNFTNILLEAFTRADPKSAKKTYDLTVFFVLLGSAHIKALCKMFGKSKVSGWNQPLILKKVNRAKSSSGFVLAGKLTY